MLLNRDKLAEMLGCSLRTVDEYRRQGMPGEAPLKPGGGWRFDSSEVINWLRTRERQSAIGEIASIDEGEAKRRKLAAEAAIAEHSLATLQGEAVSIADWQDATAKVIGAARAKLLSIGAAMGPELAIESDPDQCETLVQSAINEALQELSEQKIQIESDGSSESESRDSAEPAIMGAASRSDSKRMGGRRTPAQSGIKR